MLHSTMDNKNKMRTKRECLRNLSLAGRVGATGEIGPQRAIMGHVGLWITLEKVN